MSTARNLLLGRGAAVIAGSFVAGSSANNFSTGALAMPAGIAAGDMAWIFDVCINTGATPPTTPTLPSGWTQRGTTQTIAGGGFAGRLNIYTKQLTASESGVTLMTGSNNTEKWCEAWRLSAGGVWGTPASINHQISLTTIANQNITVSGSKGIVIGVGDNFAAGGAGAFTLNGAGPSYLDFISSRAGHVIYNSSPVNNTATCNASAGGAMASLFLPFS
jgi:hypothetical protein